MTRATELNKKDDFSSKQEIETNENTKDVKEPEDINKENPWTNRFFMFLTFVCYFGTLIMVISYDSFWQERLAFKPEGYQIPKPSDFLLLFVSLPVLIAIKVFFDKYVSNVMYTYLLSKKYKNPQDEDNYNMGQIYKKKLSTSLFKIFFYSATGIIGHYVFKDLSFFPAELFGNGDMMNIFKPAPEYLFFEKSEYFNVYYMMGLSFTLTDLIWLLFIYENQSDFWLMLLHHSITISLITFSYIFNYSQIGCIVLFLHDLTDILVYVVRIVINTDIADYPKLCLGFFFLSTFIFYRLYLFGKLIYLVGTYLNDWNTYMTTLWVFKIILWTMHVYWLLLMLARLLWYFKNKKFEDVGKVQRKNK
mmetsp:Transcript_30009/g.31181  ORF Transcript_30009/g.31181 Transcript_30009/m.31181 type:complete len:362 (-) Transcript_30009:35-1120(-)